MTTQELANKLAQHPMTSTRLMNQDQRTEYIKLMLQDLKCSSHYCCAMATIDGFTAATWALEVLENIDK
jgi:hypothetical protein